MIHRTTTKSGEVRYRVRVYANGTKHWIGSFPLRKDAVAAERDAKNRVLGFESWERPKTVTMRELCDEWTGSRKADLTEGTMADYSDAVARIKRHFGERTMVAAIDHRDVEGFVQWLGRCEQSRGKGYSASTVRKTAIRLRSIFRLAVRRGYIGTSPAEEIDNLPDEPRRMVRPLGRGEVDRLMAAAGTWYAPLLFVAATTGLRQAELFGLQWDSVDLDARTIEVKRQYYRGRLTDDLKTDAAYRTVELCPEALLMLKGVRARRRKVGPYVFTGERGGPINSSNFGRAWHKWVKAAKLPETTVCHHLRHTYASILVFEGCSAKAVQTRMGHSKVQTTLDLYGHLWPEDAEKARKAVDRWANGALTGHSEQDGELQERAIQGV
jgi:integrase